MTRFYSTLPGALLLSYLVYTTFVPITIAHSLILLSLAGLFGYSVFVFTQQLPSKDKQLQEKFDKLELNIKLQEEIYVERLKRCEDLTGALALASNRVGSSTSPKAPSEKKVLF
jgi:hypothetical protein